MVKNYAKGALIPNFSPEEHTVVSKEGGEVLIENESGKVYRRNNNHTKKLKDSETQHSEVDNQHVEVNVHPRKRATKKPSYLEDYELSYE